MNRLLEKLAVVLICAIGFAMSGETYAPVIAVNVSLTISAVVQLLSGKKAAVWLIMIFSLGCGVFPIMFCSFPLMLYDAMCEKKPWAVLPAVSVLASADRLSAEQYSAVLAGTLVAVIIYLRVSNLEKAVGKLIALRDDIAEKNIMLASQNIRLANAQDNEVHLATLRERNRIAREIHDNVGHMLTRSILQTGAIAVINKDENLKKPIAELRDTLDGAMTSIRTSVHDLHDDSIDLRKSIEEMISGVDKHFHVTFSYDAGEHIPGDVKLCAAGVVKEGISNAVKYSGGDKIDIFFTEHPAFYQLLLKDNGTGGKPVRRGGIGLKNMEDRAAGVGGMITFTPSDKGFVIFMTIPKTDVRRER